MWDKGFDTLVLMKPKPTADQIMAAVGVATEAADASRALRKRLGRRRTPTRAAQLAAARDRCAAAAEPLRSFIGMVAWHDLPYELESAMKDAIAKLRYERRQIGKMKL
jgi:hypothetical protein